MLLSRMPLFVSSFRHSPRKNLHETCTDEPEAAKERQQRQLCRMVSYRISSLSKRCSPHLFCRAGFVLWVPVSTRKVLIFVGQLCFVLLAELKSRGRTMQSLMKQLGRMALMEKWLKQIDFDRERSVRYGLFFGPN